MAVEWIQRQRQKSPSYAINVDSKTAVLAIANKRKTHPLAVAIRKKIIELRTSTSLTFHWVKAHAGLRGNERADYLARTAVSYNTTIAYNAIPLNRGKQLLEEHYIEIWNATYIDCTNASHTKQFIPTIPRRLSLSLWPNFTLTHFLTNHGKFRSYLHKMKKTSSPTCNCPERAVQTSSHLMTVQPIPKQSSRSTAQPYPASDPKASHTHRQRLKLPQQHPPLASRITGRNASSTATPLQRHDNNVPQHLSN